MSLRMQSRNLRLLSLQMQSRNLQQLNLRIQTQNLNLKKRNRKLKRQPNKASGILRKSGEMNGDLIQPPSSQRASFTPQN